MRIALERDDLAAAAARDRLLECRFDHRAVGIVGNERGIGALPGRTGILHDAVDIGFRQKAQQIDAVRRDIGVGRKGDDRHVARPRHLADEADRLRKQRPENDLGALVERLLGAELRRLGGAAVVFHQELDVRIIEFGDRHFRGIAHRLAGKAGIAGRRQRQDEPGFDLAGCRWSRLAAPARSAAPASSTDIANCRSSRPSSAPAVASKPAIERRRVGNSARLPPTPEPAFARTRRFFPTTPRASTPIRLRHSDILAANG